MKLLYFNGFSLQNESELFDQYISYDQMTVVGFSYGAIKALEYVLHTEKRVDKLQLLSPAFFNDKDKKYKRMQTIFFNKDQEAYCKNFLHNCGFEKDDQDKYFKAGSSEELNELLNYNWDEEKLEELLDKGVFLEVYLAENDKIIDPKKALEFFKSYGDVYFIKNKNHIL